MDKIKYIIEDKNDRIYPYHSKTGPLYFTWKYELVKQFDTEEEAERHIKFIKQINKNRILIVRDNRKILRKEKIEELKNKEYE